MIITDDGAVSTQSTKKCFEQPNNGQPTKTLC